MIQEQFNYIRITYSRDLAEAEGFAWFLRNLSTETQCTFFHMVCGPAAAT